MEVRVGRNWSQVFTDRRYYGFESGASVKAGRCQLSLMQGNASSKGNTSRIAFRCDGFGLKKPRTTIADKGKQLSIPHPQHSPLPHPADNVTVSPAVAFHKLEKRSLLSTMPESPLSHRLLHRFRNRNWHRGSRRYCWFVVRFVQTIWVFVQVKCCNYLTFFTIFCLCSCC